MIKTQQNILEMIGKTPLVKIHLTKPGEAIVLAKLEFLNPSGSIKDRMAKYMVEMAEKRGILKSGATIVEATTGNTGISFAMIAAVKKYRMIAVMPENMTSERKKLIKAFGAKVILTSASEGTIGAVNKRDKLAREIKNCWIPGQFDNIDNVVAHRQTTGKEILRQTGGKIDAFVAGVGTGGTLMGVAKALKKTNKNILIVAVEPLESAVMSGQKPRDHSIPGIGEGFIPKLVDLKLVDQIEKVKTKEAQEMAKRLVREAGILAGISSGANMVAAIRVAKSLGKDKIVVTVFPDRGERYFSENIFI